MQACLGFRLVYTQATTHARITCEKIICLPAPACSMAHGAPGAGVYTWGTGRSGELGHDQLTKDQICPLPQPVRLVSQRAAAKPVIVSVAACEGCSAAVTSDGRLFTWGASYKLGHSSAEEGVQAVPTPLAALGGVHIVQVSAGEYHVGCVSREGRLFLWGKSEAGCCGDLNASTHKLLEPFELLLAPAVAEMSQVLQQQPQAVLVECGYRTTLALLKDRSVLTWGCGAGGRLGHGDSLDRHTPTLVKALAGHNIVAASMGSCHTTVRPKAGGSDLEMGKIHAPSRMDHHDPAPAAAALQKAVER